MKKLLKNPFINALLAELYIIYIVSVLQSLRNSKVEIQLFIPIFMLSLLVLSVAVMSYLFFAEPIKLFLEGQKEEAFRFFIKTILTFGILVLILITLLLL
ncbi:MAG: hypothetical protein MRY49_02270 [Candidatus Pacebacteria bacterium]|nr:hypothetical protein [Candidatus Paceibacterota bacterium]